MSISIEDALKINIPNSDQLYTDPSSYWKVLVDQFLLTLDEKSVNNFKLAADKFDDKDPHLYIKDVPWFKDWWKDIQDLLRGHNVQEKD